MNARHAQLLIGLAAVAAVGIIALALLGRAIPPELGDALKTIITGLLGGGVVVGADGLSKARATREKDRLETIWRGDSPPRDPHRVD